MNDLDARFGEALEALWTGRETALQNQVNAGRVDSGTRGAVTAGGHMNALEALIVELIAECGVPDIVVKTSTGVELPGYFRPEKKWDLVILSQGRLVAAIELKSQATSFGNNFNNRVEEALGNATDVWTAFREGILGTMQPFLGFIFIIADVEAVLKPVQVKEPNFPVDSKFLKTSYADRYGIFCQRLVLERLYQATCLTLSDPDDPRNYRHPESQLSFKRFASQLQGHAMGFSDPSS